MTVAELSLNGINSIETFTTYTLWLSNFQQRHKKFDIIKSHQYLTNVQQTQSRPNHTSKTKVYFNEFVANVLHDNIG